MEGRLVVLLTASIALLGLAFTMACGSNPTPPSSPATEPTATPEPAMEGPDIDELKSSVVSHYADGVHASIRRACPRQLPWTRPSTHS